MIHKLKTWTEVFKAIIQKKKTFEVRRNDRHFMVGDTLLLREFIPCKNCNGTGRIWDNGDKIECDCNKDHGKYTGSQCLAQIKYILEGGQFGIEKDYVVMSISIK